MRLALLLFAACLGLTGCATIKSWFTSTPPEEVQAAPAAALAVPSVQAEPPEEPALKQTSPAPVSPPRAVPPAPEPRRPSVPPAPRPAAPTPPAPRVTPDPSPPVLSPVLSAVDEQKLRADTQQRIDRAAQRLRQIDPAKLASGEQDSLQTVQSFLDKAREALQAQDIQRAFTLADKAYLLADELTKR
jgi:type IV secretory pathway VirB10-like protein